MKLLIYAHSFAPQIGGVETYAMLLARGIVERKGSKSVQVTVVTQAPKKDCDDAALPFPVVRRPGISQLRRLIRESDVVHLAGPVVMPMLLALISRKPIVIEHHGYQASCPNGLLLFQPTKTACPDHFMKREYSACLQCNAAESGWFASVKMLMITAPRRWLCRRANVNLCITEHVAKRLQLPNSQVVYYGVPGPAVTVTSIAGAKQFTAAQLSVGYLGRLVEEKGVPTLIEAMHLLRAEKDRVRLTIIGDGPQRGQLEAMAGEKDGFTPRISLAGSMQGEKLSAALNEIDVLVMPSATEEPAGLVVMEQMIRGCPVIVSDHGGGAELAGDSGLKFPPNDAAALAACLRRLMNEPELLRELAERARNRATANFSLDRMIEEHMKIFGRVSDGAAR